MRPALLCLLTTLAMLSTPSIAAQKSTQDPSGTWRWESDGVPSRLQLNLEGKKLSGTYYVGDGSLEIADGQFDGKKLSFQIQFDREGTAMTVNFSGTVANNKITGGYTIDYDGQEIKQDWKAKRTTENADVVGDWDFTIRALDGTMLTAIVTVKEKGRKLTGTFEGQQPPGSYQINSLRLVNNKVSFSVAGDFNGQIFFMNFSGEPRGSIWSGTTQVTLGAMNIDMFFTGKLKPKKKQR